MSKVFASHNNIVSSLGFSSIEVVDQVERGITGLQSIQDSILTNESTYSSLVDPNKLENAYQQLSPRTKHTRLEKMMLVSLQQCINQSKLYPDERTGLIISTTKGNIDVLDPESEFEESRSYLSELAKELKSFFNFKTEPITLSNACVSGIMALSIAKRLIKNNTFDHVYVVAGDLVTPFILSGFNAFQALSNEPCRPYCKTRKGINIGEVAASILVSRDAGLNTIESVEIAGDASCNDANHISGPSRTGEGLFRSVQSALKEAALPPEDISYISAHGTATQYNDEMESIAFNRAKLEAVPLNSLKGYFGHTLGASGLLETIIGMHSLQRNTLFPSLNFKELGVSHPLNIITKTYSKPLYTFLKTSSGFGGANTAVIFKKVHR